MSNVKSGVLYTTVVCGYCEQHVYLDKRHRTEKPIANLYHAGWGKSEHFGFVCPECARAITNQHHGHVWVAPTGYIVSTKQIRWINIGDKP